MKKNKNKELIQQAIMFAINSVSEDIQKNFNMEDNRHRAETIKLLAQAYRTVSK